LYALVKFNQIFYLTDTGHRWDGDKFNVRDKPVKPATVRRRSLPLERKPDGAGRPAKENPVTNPQFLKIRFHSTKDIITAIERRVAIEKPISMDTDKGNTLQKNQNPEPALRSRTCGTQGSDAGTLALSAVEVRNTEQQTRNTEHGTNLPQPGHAQLPPPALERQATSLAQRAGLAECEESGEKDSCESTKLKKLIYSTFFITHHNKNSPRTTLCALRFALCERFHSTPNTTQSSLTPSLPLRFALTCGFNPEYAKYSPFNRV